MYDYTKYKIKHLEGNVNEIKMPDYITKEKKYINNFNNYLKSYNEKEDNIQNKIKIKKIEIKNKKS